MRAPALLCLCTPLLLLSIAPTATSAQAAVEVSGSGEATRIWASLALGGGAWQEMHRHAALGALAYSIEVTGQRGAGLLTARASGTATPLAGGVWDAGVLYGRARTTEHLHLSAAAGLSYVHWWADAFLFSDDEERSTVGVPMSATAVWTPGRHFGLGLELWGNANDVSSFFGLGALVRVGNLRPAAPPQLAQRNPLVRM